MAESSGASVAKKPHSDPKMESFRSGRKSCGGCVLPVLLTLRGRGVVRDGIHDVLLSIVSLTSSLSVVKVGTLSHFFNPWRSITSNRFVLNMVKGHHLQLRTWPPLFHKFHWFNIKAALAHHPLILKEV